MRVNKREFVRNISKYLHSNGEYELVSWNRVEVVVKITLSHLPQKGIVNLPTRSLDTYGCGCPKTDKYLCAKHGRV